MRTLSHSISNFVYDSLHSCASPAAFHLRIKMIVVAHEQRRKGKYSCWTVNSIWRDFSPLNRWLIGKKGRRERFSRFISSSKDSIKKCLSFDGARCSSHPARQQDEVEVKLRETIFYASEFFVLLLDIFSGSRFWHFSLHAERIF